jgi:archaellum biogenesis ATPase FlaH
MIETPEYLAEQRKVVESGRKLLALGKILIQTAQNSKGVETASYQAHEIAAMLFNLTLDMEELENTAKATKKAKKKFG